MKNVNSKSAKAVRKILNPRPGKTTLINFSINTKLIRQFKAVCDREGLKYSAVVSEFMKHYVETAK